MLADGLPYRTLQERLDTTAPTISRWKERFEKQRVGGLLEIRHPGQQPSVITPALQAKVVAANALPCYFPPPLDYAARTPVSERRFTSAYKRNAIG